MKCPRCKTSLTSATQEQIAVLKCAECDGIWLKQDDLVKIVNRQEKSFSPEFIQKTLKLSHAGLTAEERKDTPLCPQCGISMPPTNYNYSSGIIINSCPSHHGLWLDHDELVEAEASMAYWNKQKNLHDQEWKALLSSSPSSASQPGVHGINRLGSILSGFFSKTGP
jgi:Zn-finger nucleic acid-binding protein